jgi:hypothetical protein
MEERREREGNEERKKLSKTTEAVGANPIAVNK